MQAMLTSSMRASKAGVAKTARLPLFMLVKKQMNHFNLCKAERWSGLV